MRSCIAIVILTITSLAWSQDQSAAAPRLLTSQDLPTAVEADALQRQFDSLTALSPTELEYSPRGPVRLVRSPVGLSLPARIHDLKKGDAAADILLPLIGDILLAKGNETLTVTSNSLIDSKTRALRLSQSVRGLPVIQGIVAIDYDETSLRIRGLSANFVPDRDLPASAKLSAQQAEQVVPAAFKTSDEFRDAQFEIATGTYLAYYANASDAEAPQLVWVVHALFGSYHELVFVNAETGALTGRQQLTHAVSMTFYNAGGTNIPLPSGLNNQNKINDVNSDAQAKSARDHINDAEGIIQNRLPFFSGAMPTTAKIVVRYLHSPPLPQYGAAHFIQSGVDYLSFSPASNGLTYWTKPRDSVVHEYGHGIIKRELVFGSDSLYAPSYEPLALHEFGADLIAVVVAVAHDGTAPDNTWRIANGLWTGVPDEGLRSWRYPMFDFFSQAHNNWYPTRSFGHQSSIAYANSTILGHAYYLAAMGGQNEDVANPAIPDITVTPVGEPKAREIFTRALSDFSMGPEPSFKKLKAAALSVATDLYPGSTVERDRVKTAFEAVGICGEATSPPSAMSLTDLGDLMCEGRFVPTWSAIPGATRYYGEVGSQVTGFTFATPVTDVDGGTTHCNFQVSGPATFHIRACNDCGCGSWSQTYTLNYWSPCP